VINGDGGGLALSKTVSAALTNTFAGLAVSNGFAESIATHVT
jgi:flagellar motor component MotA